MAPNRIAKLGLIFGTLLLLSLGSPRTARALDVDATTGVFYFPGDHEKIGKAETESAESDLKFRSERDPRVVAKELALVELQQGNVCLTQADQDLQEALRSKQVLKLCHQMYKDDIPAAMQAAAKNKLKADFLRCSANVEAREQHGLIRMVLSFRAQVVMQGRMPAKLKRAGFPDDVKGYALPVREAALGEEASGWKAVLENGSCALDKKSLNAFLDRYLTQLREAKALNRCRNSQLRYADRLVRLQKQFKEYVPDAWMKKIADKQVPVLLTPPGLVDNVASLKECKVKHEATAEQFQDLQKLSARIASKYDVPALDPKNQPGSRSLASEDEDF